jgi:acyl-homoserine lactone acylase PvdQ
MKSRKAKAWTLVASMMLPGMMAWSCSGVIARTVRDDAVQGVGNAIEVTIFDLVIDALNPPEEEAAD